MYPITPDVESAQQAKKTKDDQAAAAKATAAANKAREEAVAKVNPSDSEIPVWTDEQLDDLAAKKRSQKEARETSEKSASDKPIESSNVSINGVSVDPSAKKPTPAPAPTGLTAVQPDPRLPKDFNSDLRPALDFEKGPNKKLSGVTRGTDGVARATYTSNDAVYGNLKPNQTREDQALDYQKKEGARASGMTRIATPAYQPSPETQRAMTAEKESRDFSAYQETAANTNAKRDQAQRNREIQIAAGTWQDPNAAPDTKIGTPSPPGTKPVDMTLDELEKAAGRKMFTGKIKPLGQAS